MKITQFEVSEYADATKLVYHFQGEDMLDQMTYDSIDQMKIKNLAKCELISGEEAYSLTYDITGAVSLKRFLANTLNKDQVLCLIKELVDATVFFNRSSIDIQYMVLDLDYIYIHPESEELFVICLPVMGTGLRFKPLRLIIKEILVNIDYDDDDSLAYVGKIIRYINKNKMIDYESFGAYLFDLMGDEADVVPIVIPALDASEKSAAEPPVDIPPAPEAKKKEPAADVPAMDLNQLLKNKGLQASVLRRCTGEKFEVVIPSTRIGSSPRDTEICVSNNPVISRLHARIECVDNEFYLVDNHSTNHTYLNGRQVGETPVRLEDGEVFVLANEEFVFIED